MWCRLVGLSTGGFGLCTDHLGCSDVEFTPPPVLRKQRRPWIDHLQRLYAENIVICLINMKETTERCSQQKRCFSVFQSCVGLEVAWITCQGKISPQCMISLHFEHRKITMHLNWLDINNYLFICAADLSNRNQKSFIHRCMRGSSQCDLLFTGSVRQLSVKICVLI